jgi:hypothetical protein
MDSGTLQPRYNLVIEGNAYGLGEAEFNGVLFEMVTTLVFEKVVDRVCYVLEAAEHELTGSGGTHFDP